MPSKDTHSDGRNDGAVGEGWLHRAQVHHGGHGNGAAGPPLPAPPKELVAHRVAGSSVKVSEQS